MKAVVATTQTQDQASEIINTYYSNSSLHIHWADINPTSVDKCQVTVIYETQAEAQGRLEKEWQQSVALVETQAKKTRKQPTAKQLNAKAQDLMLYHVEIVCSEGNWQIRNQYGKFELIYQCRTATGVSRKLTAMYWDKQITHLKSEGLIQA